MDTIPECCNRLAEDLDDCSSEGGRVTIYLDCDDREKIHVECQEGYDDPFDPIPLSGVCLDFPDLVIEDNNGIRRIPLDSIFAISIWSGGDGWEGGFNYHWIRDPKGRLRRW